MEKSAVNIAMPGASAPAARKEATMPEEMEIGEMKGQTNSMTAPYKTEQHPEEPFFSVEEFLNAAVDYLKSLIPSQS